MFNMQHARHIYNVGVVVDPPYISDCAWNKPDGCQDLGSGIEIDFITTAARFADPAVQLYFQEVENFGNLFNGVAEQQLATTGMLLQASQSVSKNLSFALLPYPMTQQFYIRKPVKIPAVQWFLSSTCQWQVWMTFFSSVVFVHLTLLLLRKYLNEYRKTRHCIALAWSVGLVICSELFVNLITVKLTQPKYHANYPFNDAQSLFHMMRHGKCKMYSVYPNVTYMFGMTLEDKTINNAFYATIHRSPTVTLTSRIQLVDTIQSEECAIAIDFGILQSFYSQASCMQIETLESMLPVIPLYWAYPIGPRYDIRRFGEKLSVVLTVPGLHVYYQLLHLKYGMRRITDACSRIVYDDHAQRRIFPLDMFKLVEDFALFGVGSFVAIALLVIEIRLRKVVDYCLLLCHSHNKSSTERTLDALLRRKVKEYVQQNFDVLNGVICAKSINALAQLEGDIQSMLDDCLENVHQYKRQ